MQQIGQVSWDALESETQPTTRRTGMNQDNLNENMIEIEELESKIAPDQAATFID